VAQRPVRRCEPILQAAATIVVARWIDEMEAARDRRIAVMLARGILVEDK